MDGPASKRTREAGDGVDRDNVNNANAWAGAGTKGSPIVLESMLRSVSPPRKRQRSGAESTTSVTPSAPSSTREPGDQNSLRSPFQLTAIRDLPASANVDTLTVKDVFGSPNLVECWEFNYLHNLNFLLSSFDEAAVSRGLAVHVVHGFWKSDDPRRNALEIEAEELNKLLQSGDSQSPTQDQEGQGTSITLHTAYLPEPFGTHHTKMAVLFRDDDHVQVIIHTANMIPHDWTNMSQAVWRSPLLPLARGEEGAADENELCVGNTFKKDFLNYLRAYNQRRPVCRELIEKLIRYDFSAVQAVLIGSVPGRHNVLHPSEMERLDETGSTPTQWGWAALKQALRQVPIQRPPSATAFGTVATGTRSLTAEIVAQVSSIATLGSSDSWLRQTMFAALSGGQVVPTKIQKQHRENAIATQSRVPVLRGAKPQFRVIFPVADEIRRSLDGYLSGTSIHTKIKSAQQQRQLAYMNPIMCHWANDVPDGEPLPDRSQVPHCDAGRNRAAPHIKTYVRYAPDGTIDWALMTSANLSKQAWGEAKTSTGDQMRIASYELGVLVWPELLAAGATMQPVFKRDTFKGAANPTPVVPLRMPYSLPLQRYSSTEVPWVVSMPHSEPDWRGARWEDPSS
ncbi:tyrosyl-dna phosphodiesterase [Ophiostoma piceae UAMH 11346]|uniref:Tyrosyl-dna phosphodiesterase n=1 Tax=Ophiostoma piceae (strain UAMH 11346) TaxID=1262450 RepID=S3BQ60_OPHP1|nr:tyrosyl-dna phosphodiesterase [Ophiostoma piceae UAMH 11346]